MANTYRDDQVEVAPPWLQGPVGRAWLAAFGGQKDVLADWARQAVKAGFPLLCPVDALPLIAEERGLPRGDAEPEANFRARLAAAWDAWLWAGAPYGLLRAMQLSGYPSVLLQCQSGRQWTLGPGGATSDLSWSPLTTPHLGGAPELWSDIAILITQPWPAWWGGVAPANGSPEALSAAALVGKWKGAHNRCVALKVVSGQVWGLTMTWGAFTWGAGTSVIWNPPSN